MTMSYLPAELEQMRTQRWKVPVPKYFVSDDEILWVLIDLNGSMELLKV